jgi:hypothetical protein
MATIEITKNELLEALFTATQDAPKEARTVKQLAEITGWGVARVQDAIGRLAMQDRIEVHRLKMPGIDGRNISRPAYTILPPKKKR